MSGKFLFTTILVTIVFRLSSAPITDTLTPRGYSEPTELILSTEGYSIDAFFFPIGWSKKGLFAYAGIAPLEGNDAYSVSYAVYNLTTDSCLWQYNDYGEYAEPPVNALKASWVKQRKKIENNLAGYEIENRACGNFLRFPIKFLDDTIFSDLKLHREINCPGNPIVESDLYIRTLKKGTKRVTHQIYGCDAPGFSERTAGALDSLIVIGALLSPFESRIAIISGVLAANGEPPRPMMYRINGAHLINGFNTK